ncbi:uncharacterized protein LOC108042812 isoform X5 [Drosophila rhopaloa]|uniref:Uncharacterized protein LOC108042812 isoform X5 n=1 Tax=Drosophila rhopaloa TaxID=1041015 RepID=A0A6P4EF38_DRORH|nr:uncharacterized protein LOC108042812 isoform X5 [Drosophila rhopaloa]
MDLPSMVQRSGDTLIVRSVVSGNQLYTEQGGHNPAGSTGHIASNATSNSAATQAGSSLLERHVERYRLQQQLQQAAAAVAVVNSVQQQQQQQQQQHHQQQQQQAVIGMDAKEEGLPQCKIKRNYSCNHCAYFTQNPRYHLTHLRDVHGEKIVINKCKLCLYASRHFQKLVRHMKMVHGCTDGIPSGHGQARGKRGMSREARKRRLEESVGVMGGQNLTVAVPDVPTLEQVKRELLLQEEKLQRDIQAFNQRQREEQQREQRELELVASSAYERHMQVLRDYERQSPAEPPTPSPTSGSATPPSNGEEPQNRLLKCSACEFTTLYRTQLRAHELAEHGKTKFFRCDKCSYVTHIKARFSKHVKYHSMPMIKCVTCDFRTPYKWNLDRHMKNHGGAGAFKCAACDFTADIKQSLTVHEMNHHVPPVGNAGSIWPRRQNKVGASEMCEDFLSDSAELEDQFNNNNVDDELDGVEDADPDEAMSGGDEEQHQLPHHHHYGKRSKYDEEEEPTDLSQKGGCSSDTSSVGTTTPRAQRPVPNLIPISKGAKDVLNLSKETNASRSSLTEIASMFFNEKQISEMLDKSDVPQLSPATTVASQNSTRSQLTKKTGFLERVKSGAHYENLVCQCGHVAKCLSESIIHGKSCHASAVIIDDDDVALHEDDADDRLEIDEDDEDHHSHSALNLSVTGSTRCQHCRHRCKSSTDLLHHLKQCVEAIRCANEMYDSNSGESGDRRPDTQSLQQQAAVQQQRVCIWNKATKEIVAAAAAASLQQENSSHSLVKSPAGSQAASNEENSYYGVETAPGYGEVTKKMTPEEEAANSSLKKVYKCPHCSFWASTASRFHVHIVGHLNKKPFECSLCSYRSNWRWDITKHIRLKTIRDPSHKTAKVLMNDETGRRNYTKYNKYITLMKVTEEDGDPKLMKSGEMTPNQVASLAFLKDYAKVGSVTGQDITLEPVLPSKPNVLDDAHLADNLIRIPLLATMMNAAMAQQQHHQQQQQQKEHQSTMITPSVTISPVKRPSQGSVMQGKPSDDLITEVHQEGNEKRTVYRCRKCNFGHQNRDAVLAHVKIHYQDASYPKSNSAAGTSPLQVSVGGNPFYMNKVFAAMCLSQQTQSQSSPNGGSAGTSPAISAGLLQRAIQEAQHSPTPNASALSGLALALVGGKPQANTTKASAASILEHGEQKASQNERHCRLKHSGDIRIETLERGASGSTNAPPIYRPLGAGASNESQSHIPSNPTSNVLKSGTNATAASNNNAQLLMTTKQLEQLLHSPLSASAAAVVNAANSQQDLQVAAAYWAAACKVASSSAEELLQLQQNDQIEITRLPSAAEHSGAGGNNTKSKQQKCPVCPYISESKSQMNYHVSLHKPTQYECRLCTFVCAKKQHLSSHMRSVHQQQMATGAGASVGGGGGAPSQCLDFSVAYQLAAAAKQVQQLPASTPLSIDLSQLQLDAASDAELNPQQLPPEYQYKLISYCPRCPARFAQKHNDERNAKQELEEHLLAHNDQESEDQGYVCAYCEYRTAEETLLQLHRAVHMSHYQEKCQQLYKNCKEDVEFPAPKLLQLTGPETIWVVDNELSLQLLQQTTGGGVSSSTGNYDNQNSLLKKQLESGGGQVVAIPRESSVSKIEGDAPEEDEERRSSSTPSTSASVATSDLAADASSDAGSVDMPQSVPAPQRCLHCPFETQQHEELLQHLQKHACVNTPSPGCQQCAHCDYSAVEESEMEEHTALHFNASEKLKSVEFYTCYDQLEISVEREPEDKNSACKEQQTEHNNNQDNVMNANVQQEQGSLDEEPADEAMEEPPAKKPSTKLILYKNEGGLSVKPPQEEATLESQKGENISDRLRRRILRGSANQPEDSQAQERPPTPDKMILVNARTGKVISKK